MNELMEVALIAVVCMLFTFALGVCWGICWARAQRTKTFLKNMEKEMQK